MITYELNPEYLKGLEGIAGEIQESEELQRYLEEEEEDFFGQLKEQYEPKIADIYQRVAADDPLQLIAFEQVLLDPVFEGLYLPRILGHSVLRGEINEQYKYVRPQEHFKAILMTICNSSNFDILKKRIGQTIQMGFALSSDIWVTSLINDVQNRKVRNYLLGQKIDRYRVFDSRKIGYERYSRQFKKENFHSADFPETTSELHTFFNSLKNFLLYRAHTQYDNGSLVQPLNAFISNEDFQLSPEHLQISLIYAAFIEADQESRIKLKEIISKLRKEIEDFDLQVMQFFKEMHSTSKVDMTPKADQQLSEMIDQAIQDDASDYFGLMDTIHGKGYTNPEVHEAIKDAYNRHDGMSLYNENLRRTIYGYFKRFISNLEATDYTEYFEISKLIAIYQEMFGNQKFVQGLKDQSMIYVRRLLKKYTDKRGRDYQDIKKFVSTTFRDFGYLSEKEIVELFKTRRKRKKVSAE